MNLTLHSCYYRLSYTYIIIITDSSSRYIFEGKKSEFINVS
uniref:Uncharacterized protein n=1 Tax=Lepeophtheirus salmonis TaxID=72036 RepID=A0A0K2T4E4_LEPSM